MSQLIGRDAVRLPEIPRRRPTLEVHVPISPTPSFLYQLRCLTHSLRRFGGAYRDAPVVATVGGDPRDEGMADRMPWLADNGIELRWVPADEFAALGIWATVSHRLQHPFKSDMVLLLDADTLVRRPLNILIERSYRDHVLAGVIAHSSPLDTGKLEDPDWARLFAICGLPEPRLEYEHTGWGYYFSEPRHRYCPAYFNGGVIAVPADLLSAIGPVFAAHLARLRAEVGGYYDTQIALSTAISQLAVPVLPLPMRYNMPNHPFIEALHHVEIEPATILHLLAELHFRRVETFSSRASLEAFLARTDLRLVSAMAQEVIGAILPAIVAEEPNNVAEA
jgi:hypothetical protein